VKRSLSVSPVVLERQPAGVHHVSRARLPHAL